MTDAADVADLEAGRRLFAGECRFVAGADRIESLPPSGPPEIAFAGRSNVGKSSLVNALTGRTTLARISRTPGRTQQLNFFDLGGRLALVDMPGFGYANVAKTKIKQWSGLIEQYLRGRQTLRRVCLLVDSRHGLKPVDRAFMERLDAAAVSYQVVLTKIDKVTADELRQRIDEVAGELARHPAAHPAIVATSAEDGRGTADLRAALAMLAEPARFD
ncbi:MAG TPA: ribosome biogenesis GTP-binding protein YihA/YsxC [Methylomirabilota bacterium]|nr:ribosome biogenesis GTP-binding protein YihA/YsxC [Methylomirabilota bacterium]